MKYFLAASLFMASSAFAQSPPISDGLNYVLPIPYKVVGIPTVKMANTRIDKDGLTPGLLVYADLAITLSIEFQGCGEIPPKNIIKALKGNLGLGGERTLNRKGMLTLLEASPYLDVACAGGPGLVRQNVNVLVPFVNGVDANFGNDRKLLLELGGSGQSRGVAIDYNQKAARFDIRKY